MSSQYRLTLTRLIRVLALGLCAAQPLAMSAEAPPLPHPPLNANIDRIFAKESTPVLFTSKVNLPPAPGAPSSSSPEPKPNTALKMALIEVSEQGNLIRYIGPMSDEGVFGDRIKWDGVFTRKLQINEKKARRLYFAAVDETAGVPQKIEATGLASIEILGRPSFLELIGNVWNRIHAPGSSSTAPPESKPQ